MPIEYIIYRAIQNSNLEEERKKLLNKKYNITENEELFIKLEQEFKEKSTDNIMLKEIFNRKTVNREEIVATMNHYYNLKNIAETQKVELQEEIKQLKNEIDSIYGSKTWKIAETLRKIKNIGTKRGKK